MRTAVHRAISKFKAGVGSSSSSCDDDDGESKGGGGARSPRGPAAPTGKVIRVGYIHKKGGGSSTFSRRNWKKRCVCDTRYTAEYLQQVYHVYHVYMQCGVCIMCGESVLVPHVQNVHGGEKAAHQLSINGGPSAMNRSP